MLQVSIVVQVHSIGYSRQSTNGHARTLSSLSKRVVHIIAADRDEAWREAKHCGMNAVDALAAIAVSLRVDLTSSV